MIGSKEVEYQEDFAFLFKFLYYGSKLKSRSHSRSVDIKNKDTGNKERSFKS